MNSNVGPRLHPDDQVREDWEHLQRVLVMVEDQVHAGAVLTIRRPEWLGAGADPVELARQGIMRKIDAILSKAKAE